MPAPYDDDEAALAALAARLAALSSSTTTRSSAATPTDADLTLRFQQLFARTPGGPGNAPADDAPAEKDGLDVDVLVSSQHPDDAEVEALVDSVRAAEKEGGYAITHDDEAAIEALLEEAAVMGAEEGEGEGEGEVPHWFTGEEEEEVPEWLRGGEDVMKGCGGEEEEVLRRVAEEVEWERRHGVVSDAEEEEGSIKEEEVKYVEDGGEDDDGLEALAKRFQALGGGGGGGGSLQLPAAPKLMPGLTPKKKEDVGVSEIDTWCCEFSPVDRLHLLTGQVSVTRTGSSVVRGATATSTAKSASTKVSHHLSEIRTL